MIPREIVKKIRQIELRTNRIVNETLAGELLQSPAQCGGISCPMKNRNHDQLGPTLQNREVNGVRPAQHFDFLSCRPREGKLSWIFSRFGKCRVNFACKSSADPACLGIVPCYCFFKFCFGLSIKNDAESHSLARYRFSISAKTSSIGRQRSGWALASAARRSSSAICSGVKSGSIPSSRRLSVSRCANSIRSASGSAFAALNNSIALMAASYSCESALQAAFFRYSRFTHHVSRLP
jgi:hypothetical protein